MSNNSPLPVETTIKMLVADKSGKNFSEITKETNFITDLGLDSLDRVELIMDFEQEFMLEIPDEEAEKINTVGDAIDYIQVKLFNKGGWGFGDPRSPLEIEEVVVNRPSIKGHPWDNFIYNGFPGYPSQPYNIGAASNSTYGFNPGGAPQPDECPDPFKPKHLTCDQWLLMNGNGFVNWLKSQSTYNVYKPESWLDSQAVSNGMTVAGYITDRIGLAVDSMGPGQLIALGRAIRAMGYVGTALSGYKLYTAVSDGNITTSDVLSGVSFALGVIALIPGVGTAVGLGGLVLLSTGSLIFGIAADNVNDSTLINFSPR